MNDIRTRLLSAARAGMKKGFFGFLWILKILIPISFFTLLLDAGGVIGKIDFLLTPLMKVLSLPAVAALPLIIGLLTGIYGAVAAMAVLPMTLDQMTLTAIFLLISHNLIQEGIIQGKSGINPLLATVFRLAASIVTVMVTARFLPSDTAIALSDGLARSRTAPFLEILGNWAAGMGWLSVKILAIIVAIMVTLETMKAFQLISRLIAVLQPAVRFMGLDRRVGMLWLTACLFGITYGAAVIVEEAKESDFDADDLTRLHLSIGINHAVIEDPSLFLPLGIGAFWLWVPRLISAVAAVWLLNLWFRVKRRREARQRFEIRGRLPG
ncbi:iron transporter [Desulfococcus sp.]|uniref:iron transporter n=1 Tax=Desulfococcus sp. TaxID=2025834 RepID=UPI003593E2A9